MSKIILSFCSLFFLFQPISAQTGLMTLLDQISGEIKTVQGAKAAFTQVLTYDKGKPYQLELRITANNEKGSSFEDHYLFNLADIDPNGVQYATKRELIEVELKVKGNQKFIKKYTNGELQNYTSSLVFYAVDVDNARNLQTHFREAIVLAKPLSDDRLQLDSYQAMLAFLEKNLTKVQIGEEVYEYDLRPDSDNPSQFTLRVESSDSKKNSENVYYFDLGDFNAKDVNMKIQGKNPILELATKGNEKYIHHLKDGVQQAWTNELELNLDEVDKARDLVNVFSALIPICEKEMEARIPEFKGADGAVSHLAKTVNMVGEAQQSLAGSCKMEFATQQSSRKGETQQRIHTFYLQDIDAKKTEIKVNGTNLNLVLKVQNNDKFIEVFENGEKQNYQNSVEILAPDIATVKGWRNAFATAIEGCSNEVISPVPESGIGPRLAWLSSSISDITDGSYEYQQSLTAESGNECGARFVQTKTSAKQSEEMAYEYNWADIDPDKVQVEISGSQLSLSLPTKGNEKIIKAYENGEVDPYVSEINIRCATLEEARNMKAVAQEIIRLCVR